MVYASSRDCARLRDIGFALVLDSEERDTDIYCQADTLEELVQYVEANRIKKEAQNDKAYLKRLGISSSVEYWQMKEDCIEQIIVRVRRK